LSERRSNLIVISAPSGTGKSTVLERVLKEVDGLRFSVSHTTRAPRPGEKDGVQYRFVSREAFLAMVDGGEFLEWADVHGQLYGTSRTEYDAACSAGVDLLLDIDVKGATQVRARVSEAIGVFILPPSFAALEARLRGRAQDSVESIETRLQNARREVAQFREYDYVVVNEELESCVHLVKCIIQAARCRTARVEWAVRQVIATFNVSGDSLKP
jgi:guanylate kinase